MRPEELIRAAQACGLSLADIRGMRYLPLVHRASWTRNSAVNYVASFHKPAE